MPELGEKRSVKIKPGEYRTETWVACPNCGSERWTRYLNYKSDKHRNCQDCKHQLTGSRTA